MLIPPHLVKRAVGNMGKLSPGTPCFLEKIFQDEIFHFSSAHVHCFTVQHRFLPEEKSPAFRPCCQSHCNGITTIIKEQLMNVNLYRANFCASSAKRRSKAKMLE